ncbi:MAG: hypothetical protein HQK89_05575 [Nitrospirae bacterium]|nr:hypothetical protein [Nitrospirota bacterium]
MPLDTSASLQSFNKSMKGDGLEAVSNFDSVSLTYHQAYSGIQWNAIQRTRLPDKPE